MSIYTGQGFVRINLTLNEDISASSSNKIIYKKPNGTTGEWDAEVVGTNVMRYNAGNTTFDIPGIWRVQPKFVLGGLVGYGKPYDFKIEKLL